VNSPEPTLLSIRELAQRWHLTPPAVKVRVRKYGKDIREKPVPGNQHGMAVTEQEADRIEMCVLDAINKGQRAGGKRTSFGDLQRKKKSHRAKINDGMRYFAEQSEDFAFPDTKRYREPGEIVAIIGTVTKRPPQACSCDECVEHVQRTYDGERYIGCRQGMLSLHPEWELKKGVKLYRDVIVPVFVLNEDGTETEGPPEVVEGIRRSEVSLYDPCRWYKPIRYVDKSEPIKDSPTKWEVEPDKEEGGDAE